MPQYKNAADVRVQHPGVYDDLSDAQIEQGLARHSGTAAPSEDGKFHDRGAEPLYGSMTRYAVDEMKGAAHALSPSSLWDSLKAAPGAVVKGLTQDLPTLVQDPSLLKEAPSAMWEFLQHPQDVGGMLAQTAAAEAAPGLANAALRSGPSMLGRGMGAVGRGAEAAGTLSAKVMNRGVVPIIIAATRPPWLTAAELAAPPVLKAGGRALQRGGAALEGLDLSFKGRTPDVPLESPPASDTDVVRETVNTARGYKADGASTAQASQRAGWPLGQSMEVPYRAGGGADVSGARGADQAAANAAVRALAKVTEGDAAWSQDASAQPEEQPSDIIDALDSRISGLSPLDRLSRLSGRARP